MFRVAAPLRVLGVISIAVCILTFGSFSYPAQASGGISAIRVDQFDCATFKFAVTQAVTGGFAAVRIWAGQGSTPIVDSFMPGFPSSYTSIYTLPIEGLVNFPVQPAGTKLVARVYRAPLAQTGSWDGGGVVDTTITCANGVPNAPTLIRCDQSADLYEALSSGVSPNNGFVAVRLWANGVALIDSFVAGFPANYYPVSSLGTFQSFAINFPPQPGGTQMHARLYHALVNQPGSWDSGAFTDTFLTCTGGPTATLTPMPTITPTPTPQGILTKTFNPATIPADGTTSSIVEIAITNPANNPQLSGLNFTDTLPTSLTLTGATDSTCGGTLSAPAGGHTITLTGGILNGGFTCIVGAPVTSTTPGVYTNNSSNISGLSSNIDASNASATLTVTP